MATRQPISDQLRKAVLKCGKTRYRISMETAIPQATLSRFVNQGVGLSLDNIDKLCECIGARLVLNAPKTKRTQLKTVNAKTTKRKGR